MRKILQPLKRTSKKNNRNNKPQQKTQTICNGVRQARKSNHHVRQSIHKHPRPTNNKRLPPIIKRTPTKYQQKNKPSKA